MAAAAAWRAAQTPKFAAEYGEYDDYYDQEYPQESMSDIMGQLNGSVALRHAMDEERLLAAAFAATHGGQPTGSPKCAQASKSAQVFHPKPWTSTNKIGGEFENLKTNRRRDLTPWEITRATVPERSWPTSASSHLQKPPNEDYSNGAARASPTRRVSSHPAGNRGVRRARAPCTMQQDKCEDDLERTIWDALENNEGGALQQRLQHMKEVQLKMMQQPDEDREVISPVQRTVPNRPPVEKGARSCSSPPAKRAAQRRPPQADQQDVDWTQKQLLEMQRQIAFLQDQVHRQAAGTKSPESPGPVPRSPAGVGNHEDAQVRLLRERRKLLCEELQKTDRCLHELHSPPASPVAPRAPRPEKPRTVPRPSAGGPFAGPRGVSNRTVAAKWEDNKNGVAAQTYNHLGPRSDGQPLPPIHPLWS